LRKELPGSDAIVLGARKVSASCRARRGGDRIRAWPRAQGELVAQSVKACETGIFGVRGFAAHGEIFCGANLLDPFARQLREQLQHTLRRRDPYLLIPATRGDGGD